MAGFAGVFVVYHDVGLLYPYVVAECPLVSGSLWGDSLCVSSYFFIIIAAGHIWKFITLAYIPPTIAGIVLAYRGKYLLGGALAALFGALQIMSNHVQMSYYFLFVILAVVIAYAVEHYRSHTLPRFFKATGVLVVAALLAVGANASNLYHTYKYSKESMRGGHTEPDIARQFPRKYGQRIG